jgi:hypothetical protein
LAAPAGCGWDTINLVLTRKLHCLFCVRSSDASVPYSLFKPQAYAHTTTSSHTPPPSPAPTTARPNPQTHPLYSSSRPFPTSPLLSWYPHHTPPCVMNFVPGADPQVCVARVPWESASAARHRSPGPRAGRARPESADSRRARRCRRGCVHMRDPRRSCLASAATV